VSIRILASFALALLPAAAHAADATPSVTKARNSAVGYALTLDQVTRTFARTCDATNREAARVAHASWNERNAELVRSADRYLEFVQRLLVQTQGEAAARRFYEEQKTAFASRAQLTVTDSMMSGSGDRDVCGRVLDAMADGRMDLASPAHRGTLEEIRAEQSARGR